MFAGFAAMISVAAMTAGTAEAAPAAYGCTAGYFCIFNGSNGTGDQCQWAEQDNPNTHSDCSWLQLGWLVRSVYNRHNYQVQYYLEPNYNSRVGSTVAGGKGNLTGTYQIDSFKPQT